MNVTVIGGGLAGSEAAWALAERGHHVILYEMRPVLNTPAHQTSDLGELVCTNSFKSVDPANAHGLLKAELAMLGSLLLTIAEATKVPGGTALAVDRREFSGAVTRRIESHPRIELVREQVSDIPSPSIVATGPLTSDALATSIAQKLGVKHLVFFDAIAPIVSDESLSHSEMYLLSRYGKGDGDDYLNAPFSKEQYYTFVEALRTGEQHRGHEFEKVPYFEGCLPAEEMASRGPDVLRFGPMKPVGLPDPRSGREPYAVLQLRREDRAGQMWNLVGFQTRLKIPAQREVFRTIPGLADAEFLRFGSIHRNTYLNSPAVLSEFLSMRDDSQVLFAGQLVGVEGYTESLGTGLLCGINMARMLSGEDPLIPPAETMLGSLLRYVNQTDPGRFQPMNANFGLLPPLESRVRDRGERRKKLVERALAAMTVFAGTISSGAPVS